MEKHGAKPRSEHHSRTTKRAKGQVAKVRTVVENIQQQNLKTLDPKQIGLVQDSWRRLTEDEGIVTGKTGKDKQIPEKQAKGVGGRVGLDRGSPSVLTLPKKEQEKTGRLLHILKREVNCARQGKSGSPELQKGGAAFGAQLDVLC